MKNMDNTNKTLIIAITGGVGSGKSTVAKIFEEKGFTVISTDIIAKNVINQNEIIRQKLIETFGEKTFIDGIYNAEYISKIVFESENAKNNLMKLNQIVHPTVIDEMIKEIEILLQKNLKIIFVESALIFELGLENGFDYIISVSASAEIRTERIRKKTSLSDLQIKNRISQQISQEEKNKTADFVIENEKGHTELKKSIDFILPIILELPSNSKEN